MKCKVPPLNLKFLEYKAAMISKKQKNKKFISKQTSGSYMEGNAENYTRFS